MDHSETNPNQQPLPPFKDEVQKEQEALSEVDQQIKEIKDQKLSEAEENKKLDDLGKNLRLKALQEIEEVIELEEKSKIKPVDKKIINEKKQAAVIDLRKMVQATKKGIIVNNTPKNQAFIKHLADKQLEDLELVNIFELFDEYIFGERKIEFSQQNQEMTDFEMRIMNIDIRDAFTGNKIKNSLVEMSNLFGKEPVEMRRHFGRLTKLIDFNESRETEQVVHEFFRSFPEKQKDFVRALYEPKKYLELIEAERGRIMSHEEHFHHFGDKIKKMYLRVHGRQPNQNELAAMIDRDVNIEVSELIANNLTDIMNQLYRELNIAKSDKQFNEFESEDFMHGILTTRSTISRALNNLNSTFDQMEQESPEFSDSFGLYKLAEENTEVREIMYEGNLRPVSRTKAMLYNKKIKLSDYINVQISELSHWRGKTGLFHDVSLAFAHPSHDGPFYKPIAGAAEHVTGVFLDDILSMPDAELSIEAFQFYNKMLQEETAKMDHRLSTSTLQNKFNEFNTQVEEEIIEYLKLQHGKDITAARIISAVNSAVGMGRAIFMTGPELQAYVDPLTGTGGGTFFSSGTNDASSVTVLNPLYVHLRWGGAQHLRQVFFMKADGQEAKSIFDTYDHKKTWEASANYLKSFFDKECGREGTENNLVIDKILNLTKTASLYQRGGWRDATQFESHFSYDKNENLRLLDSFKSMDIIGYEAYNWFLKNIDGVDLSKKTYGEKITGPEADQREELFKHIYDKYFIPLLPDPEPGKTKQTYEEYIEKLRVEAIKNVKKIVTDKHTLPFDNYDKAVQKEISNLFVKGAISREVAARFPTKFLRIDKDRLHKNGRSRWREVYEKMKEGDTSLTRDNFSKIMKDLEFAEGLLRYKTSKQVQENIHILPMEEYGKDRSLGQEESVLFNLNEKTLFELLNSTTMKDQEDGPKRIENVLKLYKLIKEQYISKSDFLDGEAVRAIEEYPFSFGAEDTDLKLIAYRGSGPRPVARMIGDVAAMEEVVNGFLNLPVMFTQIAKSGDYSELIKYLLKSQDIIRGVQGVGNDFDFNYMVAGMLINYLRKDTSADILGGIGGVGKINSIAAEIAGSSNLVREWDVRDIQQFLLALQQVQLLPKNNIDTSIGPQLEKIWKIDPATGLPKDTGMTKQKEVYASNIDKAMKNFGAGKTELFLKVITEILPLALALLLWNYIKKAFEEMIGGKKG